MDVLVVRWFSPNVAIAIIAGVTIAMALYRLHGEYAGVQIASIDVGGTPVTLYRPMAGAPAPMIVIAHGFAGSGRLMQSLALTLVRNGYNAATFDFPGHGRNPAPLTGDLASIEGATRVLVTNLAAVAAAARPYGDGRIAVLGHSMASDIVVRFAQEHPEVAATVALSMFSPAVTATSPRDLLVIDGDWEGFLKAEGARAVGLASAPAAAEPGVTYGDPAAGNGRRLAFSRHVEHVGVLFSQDSGREAVQWFDAAFGVHRATPIAVDARGPWILALLAGVVAFARPMARLLPVVASPPVGAGLPWRRFWPALFAPMVATPIVLRFVPTHFLPVLVGDYLVAHFALYGLLSLAASALVGGAKFTPPSRSGALALAAAAIAAYGFVGLVLPTDTYVTSFVPGPERQVIVAALLVGALLYFFADEWLTRGVGAARGAYPASKLAFLASLAIALALDFERLFFLALIVPVIGVFFIIHGLFSGWAYARVGHPFAAATANAIAFAWAIAVTFPLVAA